MSRYEALARSSPVFVFDRADLSPGTKGLYVQTESSKVILLSKELKTTAEKVCVLVEELGHHKTSSGNIIDQSKLGNRKQERRARGWGYEELVPLDALVEAFLAGVKGRHEIAEFLEVTEDFLSSALVWYQEKYGLYTSVDEYIIYFDPLYIMVMFE